MEKRRMKIRENLKKWKRNEENDKCTVKITETKLITFFILFYFIFSGKVTSRREKIGKSDFAPPPPEIFPCYATDND